jgi:hypothetical protein
MADIVKLKSFVDAYGVCVRAGCLTPCLEDETFIREFFGLPPPSAEVIKEWSENPTRKPLTLKQAELIEEDTQQTGGGKENDEDKDED